METQTIGHEHDGTPVLGDVFVDEKKGTAWHDVPNAGAKAALWLHRFAPWLAEQVFGTLELERPFRSLLEHLGEDWESGDEERPRARRHLENHQGDPARVASLRDELAPLCLSVEERADMLAERRAILERFGVLADDVDVGSSVLGPGIFAEVTDRDANEASVTAALEASIHRFRARFACASRHLADWRRAKDDLRRDTLARHLLAGRLDDWDEERLEKFFKRWDETEPGPETLASLSFDPASFAESLFPSPSSEPAEDELEKARLLVEGRPLGRLEAAVVRLASVSERKPGSGLVKDRREERERRKQQRGSSAEKARVAEAARRVAELVGRTSDLWRSRIDDEREAIRRELSKKQRQKTLGPIAWENIAHGDLEKALHVASAVDCGFDVIDVDEERDLVLLVEVKATSIVGSEHRVHVTPNELRRAISVAGRAQKGERVAWKLELYVGLHRRVDLTPAVTGALASDRLRATLLEPAALEPTEFVLHVVLD